MKNDSVKRVLLVSSFVLFAIAMVFLSYYLVNHYNGNNQYFKAYNKTIDNELAELTAKQKTMDDKIKDIVENGDYTFDAPCIIKNPYELNPLSAIIIFNTKENVSVDVSINDTKVTTVAKSKDHIIPVYGLYANSSNFIELKLSNGKTKTIEIKTTSYNNNITGINFKEDRKDYSHTFVLGNMKGSNSVLRCFDAYDNLMMYMDFGYFSSVKYTNGLVHLGYNSEFSRDTKLVDIELQVDYMGKIVGITNSTADLNHSYNAEVGDKIYSYQFIDLYENQIYNYTPRKLVDNSAYSIKTKLETSEMEDKLVNALLYQDDYKLAVNGEYITFDFNRPNTKMNLILVTRNTMNSYMYNISNKHMIKTGVTGDVSLFLEINGQYYSLLTTINN